MDTCAACGAGLKPELEWCWRCYAPTRARSAAESTPSPSDARPFAGPLTQGTYVDPDPAPEPQYSRWRAGTNTFGPPGRLLITAVVAFFGWLTYVSFKMIDGPLVIADVGAYSAGAFFVLRHVWKRDRVA